MWIKLLQACPVFFRTEPVGTVISIGNPRGKELIAAGIAEPSSEPLDRERDNLERVRQGAHPLRDEPRPKPGTETVQVQASRAAKRAAAVAALVNAGQLRRSKRRKQMTESTSGS